MGRGGHVKGDDRNMGVTAGQEGVVASEITGEFMTGSGTRLRITM